eukprot:10493519-Alexandrium_andersonii.AAC.1
MRVRSQALHSTCMPECFAVVGLESKSQAQAGLNRAKQLWADVVAAEALASDPDCLVRKHIQSLLRDMHFTRTPLVREL